MKSSNKQDVCFVISPIGPEGSEIRQNANQALEHIIKPAAEQCGYEAIRADEVTKPGMITDDVLDHLLDDPLVIADLTGHNANVFYELAIRHMVKKPVIPIILEDQTPPFDVAQMRTISYSLTLDGAAKCRTTLINAIHAAEENPEGLNNPVSRTVDLRALQQSQNRFERSQAQILEVLSSLVTQATPIFIPQKSFPQESDRVDYYYQDVLHQNQQFREQVDEIKRFADHAIPQLINDLHTIESGLDPALSSDINEEGLRKLRSLTRRLIHILEGYYRRLTPVSNQSISSELVDRLLESLGKSERARLKS